MKLANNTYAKARYLGLLALALCGWLAYELVSDPYAEQKAAILAPDKNPNPVAASNEEPASDLNYDKIQTTANTKQTLWGLLVREPAAAPPKPDLNRMIQGLSVVTVVSANNEVQAIIKDVNGNTDQLYKKGDRIREFTIDGFTRSEVILSYQGEKVKLPF